MAEDQRSVGREAREWPFEGHFVVGSSDLYVEADCLGETFTSRTESYDLTIGLPQINRAAPHAHEALFQRLSNTPPIPDLELIPPEWAYGPRDEIERADERSISPVWGTTFGLGAEIVYPASPSDGAV